MCVHNSVYSTEKKLTCTQTEKESIPNDWNEGKFMCITKKLTQIYRIFCFCSSFATVFAFLSL